MEETMQRRVDRPCPLEYQGGEAYCYWCSEPLRWRPGRGWVHPDGKHYVEVWSRWGGVDFEHWAEPVRREIVDKLEEITKLAAKASAEIAQAEKEFEGAKEALAPFLDGKDHRSSEALTKHLEASLESVRRAIRLGLIKRSVGILKGSGEVK